MKEEQKIYIRGSKNRPNDVRRILEEHGGRVRKETKFTHENCIYYIGYDGVVHYISDIDYIPEISQLYKMITEYYEEIKLPGPKRNESFENLKKYFANTSKEQQDKEWKEIEPLNNIGPDVIEYNNKIKL